MDFTASSWVYITEEEGELGTVVEVAGKSEAFFIGIKIGTPNQKIGQLRPYGHGRMERQQMQLSFLQASMRIEKMDGRLPTEVAATLHFHLGSGCLHDHHSATFVIFLPMQFLLFFAFLHHPPPSSFTTKTKFGEKNKERKIILGELKNSILIICFNVNEILGILLQIAILFDDLAKLPKA